MSRVACSNCVQRIREGKSILSPEEAWHEALAEIVEDKLCRICGRESGSNSEELGRGRSLICRECFAGAAA
ncbi:hypothetical protein [Lentzea sp. NPDC059081]|uniref:hypothetical protein n=1 Tax=Lentzea sp. NPDC059081 TaxID=3346719 RepID=UPI00368E1563